MSPMGEKRHRLKTSRRMCNLKSHVIYVRCLGKEGLLFDIIIREMTGRWTVWLSRVIKSPSQ